MAVATAAKQVIVDRMDIVVAGGVESISLVQTGDVRIVPDPELVAQVPDIYMLPLQTAEVVAARYNVSREYQDQYSLQSQQRTAAAQAAGAFDDEIVTVEAKMAVTEKAKGEIVTRYVRLDHDEGNSTDTKTTD